MTREARSIRCPESVLGWIPWYGETDENGDRLLDARKRGAVEAHAAECPDCRAELDMISGAPYEIDVDLPDPDRVFDEITARIDAGEAEGLDTRPMPPLPSPTSRGVDAEAPVVPIEAGGAMTDDEVRQLTRWVLAGEGETEAELRTETVSPPANVVRGPWGLRPVQAAAAAAAIFLLGLLGGAIAPNALAPGDEYALAAAPEAESVGPLLDVVFVEGVTARQLGEGLRAAGLEIVSGPSSVGRYRLRAVGVEGPDVVADLQVIASRLKEGPAPLALFAEPASP
ncbi:MAG: zf-HC2 domain-containing protein [Myxococcota bacterium]